MEYKFGNITLINGDCMDYLRSMPDNAVDLCVCDPPYGDGNFQNPPSSNESRWGGWFQRYKRPLEQIRSEVQQVQESQANFVRSQDDLRNTRGRFRKYQKLPPPTTSTQLDESERIKKGIWWDVAPSEEYFNELFRVSKNQIIWGGNYFNLPPTRCFLIWRKLSISEKFSMAMVEYAWTSFNANAKMFEHTPQGTKNDSRFHPTQKPIVLYAWILNNYAKEGDRILDTHLGSGSSAIAAWELGFEFVGIEIDKEYYNNAVERFKRYTAQGKLF